MKLSRMIKVQTFFIVVLNKALWMKANSTSTAIIRCSSFVESNMTQFVLNSPRTITTVAHHSSGVISRSSPFLELFNLMSIDQKNLWGSHDNVVRHEIFKHLPFEFGVGQKPLWTVLIDRPMNVVSLRETKCPQYFCETDCKFERSMGKIDSEHLSYLIHNSSSPSSRSVRKATSFV